MTYEDAWYWCAIAEADDAVEPDWSKVPEEKRELVRSRWYEKRLQPAKLWKLWGPQIPFYSDRPYFRVTVLDLDHGETRAEMETR